MVGSQQPQAIHSCHTPTMHILRPAKKARNKPIVGARDKRKLTKLHAKYSCALTETRDRRENFRPRLLRSLQKLLPALSHSQRFFCSREGGGQCLSTDEAGENSPLHSHTPCRRRGAPPWWSHCRPPFPCHPHPCSCGYRSRGGGIPSSI